MHMKTTLNNRRASPDARIAALEAEVERLRGLVPALPERPPHAFGREYQRAGLQRFGIRWNGPAQPIAVPMDDGYWTPFHQAHALTEPKEWILTSNRLPTDGAKVWFVARASGRWELLDGRVLGGTFRTGPSGQVFRIPGVSFDAYAWMPRGVPDWDVRALRGRSEA